MITKFADIDYHDVTWGKWYWPIWYVVALLTLGIPEFYALATNKANTQSYWVWHELDVTRGASTGWSAATYFFFVAWASFFLWLTIHFFWRKFT